MGKPVDNLGGGGEMYAALGGLTSFSDLVDGVERVSGPLKIEHNLKALADSELSIKPASKTSKVLNSSNKRDLTALDLYNLPYRYN